MKVPMDTDIISPQEVRDVDMDEEFNVPCLHKPFPTLYINKILQIFLWMRFPQKQI